MAKFQGIKIRENAMVYILEIISVADFCHLGLLCGAAEFAEKELHNLQICYQPISRISINSKSLWEMQLRLSPSYAGLV